MKLLALLSHMMSANSEISKASWSIMAKGTITPVVSSWSLDDNCCFFSLLVVALDYCSVKSCLVIENAHEIKNLHYLSPDIIKQIYITMWMTVI